MATYLSHAIKEIMKKVHTKMRARQEKEVRRQNRQAKMDNK